MSLTRDAIPRRMAIAATDPCYAAARIIVAAARSLSLDETVVIDRRVCRNVAEDLAVAANDPRATRSDILGASPHVIERLGRVKTLVEMVEAEGGDEAAKLGLTKLLLRALDWQ